MSQSGTWVEKLQTSGALTGRGWDLLSPYLRSARSAVSPQKQENPLEDMFSGLTGN